MGGMTMTLEEQIRDSDAKFVRAFNSGEKKALETLHADDAMLLPPDGPMLSGSKAITEGFEKIMDEGWKNMSLHSVKLESDGSLAYHVGRVEADVPAGESTTRVAGKYVDIYKRHWNGRWKIHLTIYNMDAPLGE